MVGWLNMKHETETKHSTVRTQNSQRVHLPAVGWSKEEQRKGSGYFSPATVSSSSSGIRCGSIAYHGRRQKWRCFHVQYFFNSVKETGDIPVQAGGRSFLDDTLYPEPQCPLQKSQFHSEKGCWMRHPPHSYLGNKANLCCPVRVGFDSSAGVLHQKPN